MSKNLFCKWHFCHLVGPYAPTPTPCHQPPQGKSRHSLSYTVKEGFAASRFEISSQLANLKIMTTVLPRN